MKKLLVVASTVGLVASISAATITETAVLAGESGYPLLSPGTATGTYDTVSGGLSLSGSVLFSPSIGLDNSNTTVNITGGSGPFTGTVLTAVSFPAPTDLSLGAFNFTITAVGEFQTGTYFVNVYKTGVKVASGQLIPGSTIGSVVPEPQTYAIAAGAALLGFAAFRRARR